MCCVMPPNSFSATFDLRMASRSDVLPWSTWPMTVTTGGRSAWVPVSASSSSRTSPSTERISTSKPNLSATSLASVGSSRSLTIRMTPSSSRPLMTSPDLRRIFSASSATVTDSGTRMSSRRTSAGGAGGASGATREGSGAISGCLATMAGGSPVISTGFGLTIVAAGLTAAATSSAASAGLAFFARGFFATISAPSTTAPSSFGAFGFATRLGLTGSSGSSRPLPSLVRSSLASFASRGVMARTPLWPISSAASIKSLLVTPSSFASSMTFTLVAATVPSPPRNHGFDQLRLRFARPAERVRQARGLQRALLALRIATDVRPAPRRGAVEAHAAVGPAHQPQHRPLGPPAAAAQARTDRLGPLRRHALALDVDAHAGELGRQPRVLPLLADGERELVVGNDHQRRHVCLTVGLAALGRLLGDGHRRHLRGRQRARHERGRVVRPLDDVDLLAAQLAADDLDARAAQAHAGADGVHVALGGGHRDLGALAALARRRLDDDDPLLDLGDLRLEEPREVARVCARERDLRALGRAPHLEHVGAHAVARVVALPGDLLALGQDRLRLADLQDHVALLDPVHDAAEDLAFLADELRVDALALGVADLLEDDLLGGLGRDAAEVLQRSVLQQLQLDAELGRGIERLGVSQRDLRLRVGDVLDHLLALVDAEVARLAVDVDADVVGRPQALAGCRQQGSLQRLEEDLFVDPLLASELLDDHDQFAIHLSCDRLLQGTSASSRAFVTLARSSLASVPPSCSRTICPPSRPSSRPRTSCPPASQQHTRLPTAQRNSRSVRSWRSSPGDETSRSYASSINADASSTSPTSRLSRWQSSMPTPPGLSTNKRSTPRCRRGRHSRSTSINP